MRTAASSICVSLLLMIGGCSDDGRASESTELPALLLTDSEVADALPYLEAKQDYSTGEDYGVLGATELVGATKNADAGLFRTWTHPSGGAEGEVTVITSSILQFSSTSDANAAASEMLSLLGTEPRMVDGVLIALAPPSEGGVDALAVVTEDTVISVIQIVFAEIGDSQLIELLARAAADRFS